MKTSRNYSIMLLRLLVLSFAACAVTAEGSKDTVLEVDQFTNNMIEHFNALVTVRHPRDISRDNWLNAREYIRKEMYSYGLDVELQCFNTSVQIEYENHVEVEGCNIIGVTKGDTNKERIVVGAHYDSSGEKKNYQPLRDNGVGVALLLETARAFEESIRWKGFHKNFTTIFVAFDLNTKEQLPESQGLSGSSYFIKEWLEPQTNHDRLPIAGAYIIDSASTYNTEETSQVLPSDFSTYFPEAYTTIKESNNKGNFIAAIGLQNAKDLVERYSGHYNKDRRSRPYRLQNMVAGSKTVGTGATLQMVNHQDSFHFWMNKPSLPAVLLTDTDSNRVVPIGEDCSVDCNYVFPNPERMQFLTHTYQALSHTLLDMQTTYVGLTAASSSVSGFAALIVSMVALQFLVR